MSDEKEGFTPGPWKWYGKDLWHVGKAYLGNGSDHPHLYAGITVEKNLENSPIVKHNKRLIAAAPLMLKALKRQQANIKRWLETGIPASAEESKSISDEIDAAIEAALGKG
jgi:hypothetical protein